MVKIHAGPDQNEFSVHKDVLIESSKFFLAAFAGRFSEAASKNSDLNDISSDAFRRYVHWAYTGDIIADKGDDDATHVVSARLERYEVLMSLFIAADRVENARLRNETMTAIVTLFGTGTAPSVPNIALAYKSTPQNSKLRQFITDAQMTASVTAEGKTNQSKWLEIHRTSLPDDFIFEYAQKPIHQGAPLRNFDPRKQPKCHYHEHNEEVPPCV